MNHTAHQQRLNDDERVEREEKDDKEKAKKKKKKRLPKEISYLRFSDNLDLVDWGKY